MRAKDFLGLGVSGLMSEAAEDTCITCFFCLKLPGASDSEDGRRNPPSLGEDAAEPECGSDPSAQEEAGGAGDTVISGILLKFIGTGDGEGAGDTSMSSAPAALVDIELAEAAETEVSAAPSVSDA